jgi:hypothetical protein
MSAQPLEIRMAHLEGAYEQISERLNGIDSRLTGIDSRLTALDQKIDARFETLDRKIDIVGGRFMVAMLGSNAAVLAAIVGGILTLHR